MDLKILIAGLGISRQMKRKEMSVAASRTKNGVNQCALSQSKFLRKY
jgi:hypothetical protein